jgi:hypothetical protein
MKRLRRALLASVLTFGLAQPAHADPISLTMGIIAGLAAVGVGGAGTALAIGIGAAVAGLSYLSKALIPGAKSAVTASSLSLEDGEDVPQSFCFGYTGIAGSLVYANVWGKDGKTPNAYAVKVVALADLPSGPLLSLWDGEQTCSYGTGTYDSQMGWSIPQYDKDGKHYLWVKYHDGTQTSADSYLVTKFGSDPHHHYGSDRIGTGRAYAIITARVNEKLFTSGFPKLVFVWNGSKLYDMRKDSSVGGFGSHRKSNPSTWETTLNPQVVRSNIWGGINYAGQWMYGLQNMSVYRLPFDNWAAAMNECDTSIEESWGIFVPQYRCGGTISCDVEPASADESLMRACNARHIDAGGVYKTITGAVGSAVLAITDDDFVITEEQGFDPYVGISDIINGVSATYPNPDEGWKTKESPTLKDATLASHDGREAVADVKYECVPYPGQVQRLQKAALEEERRWRTHTGVLPHTVSAYGLECGDCLNWNSTRNGYSNKKFRIDSMKKLANLDWLTVLKEVDPADYDWNPGVDYQPVSVGSISKTVVPAQEIDGLVISGETIVGGDGSEIPVIKFQWATEDIDDVASIQCEVRRSSDGAVVFNAPKTFSLGFGYADAGISGGTTYEARATYNPISDRDVTPSSWQTITTPGAKVGGGAVDYGSLSSALADFANFVGADARALIDEMRKMSQATSESLLGSATDVQTLKQNVTSNLASTLGVAKAYADSQLTAATGPGSAIAINQATVSAQLTGISTASGSVLARINTAQTAAATYTDGAVGSLSTTIAANYVTNGSLSSTLGSYVTTSSANATFLTIASANSNFATVSSYNYIVANYVTSSGLSSALSLYLTQSTASSTYLTQASASSTYASASVLNSLSALIGDSSSSAVMRLGVASTPSDATARFAVDLAAGSAHSYIYADTGSFGSRIMFGANIIGCFVSQFVIYKADLTPIAMFDSDGLIVNGVLRARNLTLDKLSSTAVLSPVFNEVVYSPSGYQLTSNTVGHYLDSTGGFDSSNAYWYGDPYGRTLEITVCGVVERAGGSTGKFNIWLENANGSGQWVDFGSGNTWTDTSYHQVGATLAFDLDGALMVPFSLTRAFKGTLSAGGRGQIRVSAKNTNGSMNVRQLTLSAKVYNAY